MKKTAGIAIASFLLLCLSCKKNEYNSGSSVQGTSLSTVLAPMAVTPKTVSIDVARGGAFYGNSGVRYVIPANGFQTANGNAVTGTIQILASDYIKRSDMIFSGIAPISNGESLISGGEVNISATQNGTPVYLKPGIRCQVNLPQKSTPVPGMQLFYASGANKTTKTTAAAVNWRPAREDSVGISIVYHGDTIQLNLDSLQLGNADQFMTSPNYQDITVTVKAGSLKIEDSLVQAYALYDGYNGYWPLGLWTRVSNGVFSEGHIPNIPIHFVAFALVNNELYAGTLAATPTTGNNYTVNLSPITPADLKNLIDGL